MNYQYSINNLFQCKIQTNTVLSIVFNRISWWTYLNLLNNIFLGTSLIASKNFLSFFKGKSFYLTVIFKHYRVHQHWLGIRKLHAQFLTVDWILYIDVLAKLPLFRSMFLEFLQQLSNTFDFFFIDDQSWLKFSIGVLNKVWQYLRRG